MEEHLQAALDAEDGRAIARGLTRAAKFAPEPSWNSGARGWAAIADAGAKAAKDGDVAAARRSCKTCH